MRRAPPGVWRAEYVPNDEVQGLYAGSGVVLADHWPDMAREGFIANRVFRPSVDRGDEQERALAARQFAAAHSFSSRARTLVEAVVGLRRGAGPGHVP